MSAVSESITGIVGEVGVFTSVLKLLFHSESETLTFQMKGY